VQVACCDDVLRVLVKNIIQNSICDLLVAIQELVVGDDPSSLLFCAVKQPPSIQQEGALYAPLAGPGGAL